MARLCLDEICVSSKSNAGHDEDLQLVLQHLREHELYVEPSECLFNQPELELLGQIAGCEGSKVDLKETDVVND